MYSSEKGDLSFGNQKLGFFKITPGLAGTLDLDMLWTGKSNPTYSRSTVFHSLFVQACACDTCPSNIFNCADQRTQSDGLVVSCCSCSLPPSLLLWCLDYDSSDSSWFLLKLEPAVFLKLSRATKPPSKSSPPHSLTATNCSEGEKKQGAHFPLSPCDCMDPKTNRSNSPFSPFSCGAGHQL